MVIPCRGAIAPHVYFKKSQAAKTSKKPGQLLLRRLLSGSLAHHLGGIELLRGAGDVILRVT